MTPRQFSAVAPLQSHELGTAFTARGTRGVVDLNPFINIDLFEMTGRTFAVHPHAGFSVATYLFDDSTTRFANRDSLGDRGSIEVGGMRWTVSGSGIVHDEVVEETGRLGHGAQIFVRTPVESELVDPFGQTFSKADLPFVETGPGGRVRIAAGSGWGESSPLNEPTRVELYDLVLEPGASVEVPFASDRRGFLMTVSGSARISATGQTGELGPTSIATFEPGDGDVRIEAGPRGLQVLIGSGVPITTPAYMHGGFCMSNKDNIIDAIDRYNSGAMNGLISAP